MFGTVKSILLDKSIAWAIVSDKGCFLTCAGIGVGLFAAVGTLSVSWLTEPVTVEGAWRTVLMIGAAIIVIFGLWLILRKGRNEQTRDTIHPETKPVISQERLPAGFPNAYTLCGLESGTRTDDVFQDFDISRGGGLANPVHFLWADACYANRISAEVQPINDTGGNCLRIWFANFGGFGCNISIRPKLQRALKNEPEKQYLAFEARAVPKGIVKKEIAVGMRLVNGKLEHWEYASAPGAYTIMRIGPDWERKTLPLRDRNNWHLFRGDGSQFPLADDHSFDILAMVIFVLLGSYQKPGKIMCGNGTVDIRKIWLTDQPA